MRRPPHLVESVNNRFGLRFLLMSCGHNFSEQSKTAPATVYCSPEVLLGVADAMLSGFSEKPGKDNTNCVQSSAFFRRSPSAEISPNL